MEKIYENIWKYKYEVPSHSSLGKTHEKSMFQTRPFDELQMPAVNSLAFEAWILHSTGVVYG